MSSRSLYEPIDYRQFDPCPVVGVDEVGRGCLAGPVMAAAVVLRSSEGIDELTDSKLLSEKRREKIASFVKENHWYGLGSASVAEIDEINILQASLLAMKRAVEDLERRFGEKSGHLLIDGNCKIPGLNCRQTTIIKGDLRVAPISAASIVAKVTRDQFMKDLAKEYPQYGFDQHKGYASVVHKNSIAKCGPSIFHRKTFKGVKEFVRTGTSF